MVHGFVHPPPVGDEPVVDAAQRSQHAAVNSGLFRDLTDRGLLGRLTELDMAFRQRPQHQAAPVDATDECGDLLFTRPIDTVDDQPTGRCFVHGAQSLRSAPRGATSAGFVYTGRAAVGRLVAGLAFTRPRRAPTTAPSPAPTWLRIFAVGHLSDGSWRAQTLRLHSPVVSCATIFAPSVKLLRLFGRFFAMASRSARSPRSSSSSAVARLGSPACRKPSRTPNCWPLPRSR